MQKILFIAPVDLSKNDGSTIHFLNIAKCFSKLRTKVHCILYSPSKPKFKLPGKDIEIKFVPNPLWGNVLLRALKYFYVIPFIIREVFLFKPKIVYIQFSPPAFFYQLILKSLKLFFSDFKVTVEFHDWVSEQRAIQGGNKFNVMLIEKLQVGSSKLSDQIRAVAKGIKEKLLLFGINERKIAVIENGTDVNFFQPMDKREAKKLIGVNPDYLYIGFIGNFAVWQGLDHLLAAIPKVIKTYKDIRFLLVGDGPEMTKIKKSISKLEKGKIILTGSIPYQEANLYINAFDIGIAPFIKKRNDGMVSPMKIRDYAACGVPIITTKIRGLEMVEEKNIGILVSPDNPEILSEAIIKLIGNPVLRRKMGEKGRRVAEESFSWENVVEQILNTINK